MQASTDSVAENNSLIAELADYARQFLALKDEAQTLFAGLDHGQFNWRPQPGVWSVAECFDHLNVTGKLYGAAIDEKIRQARAQQLFSPGPFRYGWFGNWFVRSIEPPVKTKFKAPKLFVPQADKPQD